MSYELFGVRPACPVAPADGTGVGSLQHLVFEMLYVLLVAPADGTGVGSLLSYWGLKKQKLIN